MEEMLNLYQVLDYKAQWKECLISSRVQIIKAFFIIIIINLWFLIYENLYMLIGVKREVKSQGDKV